MFVVLEEQMILAVYVYGPVRVVEPPLLRPDVVLRLLFIVELAGVSFIMLFEYRRCAERQRGLIRRGVACFRLERCGSRCGSRCGLLYAALRCASYFMSRYVDSDGFLGRSAITAAQSTARRLYTVPLVSYAAISRAGTQLFFRASVIT